MTDKASPAGWVVQITIPGTATGIWRGSALEGAPSFQFFNVAVGAADKAIEVARKKAGASPEAPMRVVRQLSSAEIDSIGLRSGEAKAA
jgi:hypothetical protein